MIIKNKGKKNKPVKLAAFVAAAMIFSAFGISSVYSQTAVSDWTNEDFPNDGRQTIELRASEDGAGSGEAVIESAKDENGVDKVKINLDVQLQRQNEDDNMVHQAWLVDEDSNYNLSMGVLTQTSTGNQESQNKSLEFRQRMANFSIYDKIVITMDSLDDENPEPGREVFTGDITGGQTDRSSGQSGLTTDNSRQTQPMSGEINIENASWYRANLSSEGLQSNSQAMGMGVLLQDRDNKVIRYVVDTSDLEGQIREIHVYRSSENIEDQEPVLELPTDGDPVRGQLNYSEDQEDNVMTDMSYMVIKTDRHPNGEIAGSFEEVEVQRP
jgi:hypothetical protein